MFLLRETRMKRLLAAAIVLLAAVRGSSAAERPEDWAYQLIMAGDYRVGVMRREYWDPRLPVAIRARETAEGWAIYFEDYFERCLEDTGRGPFLLGVAVLVQPKNHGFVAEGMARFVQRATAAGDTVIPLPASTVEQTTFFVVAAGIPPDGATLILKCALGGGPSEWSPAEEEAVRFATAYLAQRGQ